MTVFKIDGGSPLSGSVRIGGAKNASFKLMIASLLAEGQSRLLNFSRIDDVELVANIIGYLGGDLKKAGERAIFINPDNLNRFTIQPEHGAQGRFSTMFIPALLTRFGQAVVPFPGGDKIGPRPLERHFEGLKALGAKVEQRGQQVIVTAQRLIGTHYHFAKNSHTGTETMIMAAVKARGQTILENAAQEPEIDDLITFLNHAGAKIERKPGRIIQIQGVDQLHGAIHRIIPDRNEAVSYACVALATRGDIIIENAQAKHLASFLEKLAETGGGYEVGNYGIRFYYQHPLHAVDVVTTIEPGFMTDWQPLWATLMTQAEGVSTIHETIMFDRFQYVEDLKAMGANLKTYQPQVENPNQLYNFNCDDNWNQTPHALKIYGPSQLQSGDFAVKDLRHGATLVMAALTAHGLTTLSNIEHIDRGYESLVERLQNLGANIIRDQSKIEV